jgi:hypothetical protein
MSLLSNLTAAIKSWFRDWINDETSIGWGGEPKTQEEGAKALVERSRLGDQVAMAGIVMVREQAKAGVQAAIVSKKLIEDYIRRNPVAASVGEDVASDLAAIDLASCIAGEDYAAAIFEKVPPLAAKSPQKAIVTLANGPSLIDLSLCSEILDCLQGEDQCAAFKLGVEQAGEALAAMKHIPHEAQHALLLGYIIGKARCVQGARHPATPISILSKRAGQELDN